MESGTLLLYENLEEKRVRSARKMGIAWKGNSWETFILSKKYENEAMSDENEVVFSEKKVITAEKVPQGTVFL